MKTSLPESDITCSLKLLFSGGQGYRTRSNLISGTEYESSRYLADMPSE